MGAKGFRLPRWTVYPALAVLAVFAVTAVPRPGVEPHAGAAMRARWGEAEAPPDELPRPVDARKPLDARHPRVVVLGIDGLDPELLRETMALYPDRMRNFARIIEENGLHALGTSTPPQSPVAWSNFITGLDPGGHGVFDFIHRDRVTRAPVPSTVQVAEASAVALPGDWKIPLGGDSPTNRSGESFWRTLARHGVPADIWRMPANFPVEPAEGLSFSGMMTPALDSAYGMYTIFSSDPPVSPRESAGTYVQVSEFAGVIHTSIGGPPNVFREGEPQLRAPITIYLDRENGGAAVETELGVVVLRPGEWSDFLQVQYDPLPGFWMLLTGYTTRVTGIVRFYLRSIEPVIELYASPVNIDPTAPAMPVSEPTSASADLAQAIGLYYTQGMAEEVGALKDGAIDDLEFMHHAQLVYDESLRMMDYALDHYLYRQPGGVLFFYYSTVDLTCHMVWRLHDEQHPAHRGEIAELAKADSSQWSGRPGSTWKDVVHDIYMRMDPVLGRLRERLPEDATLIVMSDHGFKSYRRRFSLNTWLLEQGYLVLKEGKEREAQGEEERGRQIFLFDAVDWTRTRAYGMGFNGLYLNLAGRELDDPSTKDVDESGIVKPGAEAEALLRELAQRLEEVVDPATGGRVVQRADIATEIYHGERLHESPDILVGYDAGYGNSDASSTGRIPRDVLADNVAGSFNGNHLMSPDVVPGVLMSNRPVAPGTHKLEDVTVEILTRYGIAPLPAQRGRPVLQ